jgi:hypothetical protein
MALFRQEYHTLSQIKHPKVVEVFSYEFDGDRRYYTMECLEGDRCMRSRPWIGDASARSRPWSLPARRHTYLRSSPEIRADTGIAAWLRSLA